MADEPLSPQPSLDARGLPPVQPPSARFLAQLFLVPGLIVLVLVLIWLGGNYLVAERRSAAHYLRELENSNPDIRWRCAKELAEVLPLPESVVLAADPQLALGLAELLRRELTALEQAEQAVAAKLPTLPVEQRDAAWYPLHPQRDNVRFLTATLGGFTIPASAPLLCEIAASPLGVEPKSTALRQRVALIALANLGNNCNRFKDVLTVPQRAEVIQKLLAEASAAGERGAWAKRAYDIVAKGAPHGVDAALARCARSDDPSIRVQVAFALNFWHGPQTETILLQLARDDGHGTILRPGERD